MKLVKLSLVTLLSAGLATCSFAADTLEDAFKNGKVSGELKSYYFDHDTGSASASILTTGLTLSYVTDSLYGFNFGTTVQANYAPSSDDDAKSMYKYDMYGSGAVLSEAYLGYTGHSTNIKIGRQFFKTPAVAGSGSRMIKESFQGASVFNKSLPNTTLMAGYVNKWHGRTSTVMGDADGNAPKFHKKVILSGVSGGKAFAFDGAYTLMAINKSIPNLTLAGQYLNIKEAEVSDKADIDVYFGEAKYILPQDGYNLEFATSVRASRTDNDNFYNGRSYDGTHFSGRIGISGLSGFGASFAAATTSSDDYLIAGISNGAGTYTATMIRQGGPTMRANTDSYLLNLSYDFSEVGVKGLKGVVAYGYADQDRVGNETTAEDYTSYACSLSYAVPSVKGLSVSVQYETQEKETTTFATNSTSSVDNDELRFRLSYKF